MPRLSIGLADLETLLAVAECGSFSAAARLLSLSQPAVTGRVRRLEQRLGHVLLRRGNGAAVAPTEAGRRLLSRAAPIVEELRDLVCQFDSAHGQAAGRVTLAATPMVAAVALPRVIRLFGTERPTVAVILRDLPPRQIIGALEAGQADLAVMVLEGRHPGMTAETLFEDECLLVTPARHPLAAGAGPLLDRVLDHPIVSIAGQDGIWSQIAAACHRRNLAFRPACQANSVHAAIAMVEAGIGITLVPETMLPKLDPEILAVSRIADRRFVRRFALVRAKGRPATAPAEELSRFLRIHLGCRGLAGCADRGEGQDRPAPDLQPSVRRSHRNVLPPFAPSEERANAGC